MNLYLRYFSDEFLAHNIDEAVDFLMGISDLQVDEALVNDLRQFLGNNVSYPKRYKVRPRVYFIAIKTTAETLEEFKANNKKQMLAEEGGRQPFSHKEMRNVALSEEMPGWYEGSIVFKRVVPIPGTGKFQYRDTRFTAQVRAMSGQDCYDRIVDHLKNRQDVDLRSQFPSSRGRNFTFSYLGPERPE